MRWGFWSRLATALAVLAGGGCGLLPRETVVPVPARVDDPAAGAPRELVVLLPGRFSRPREFEEAGVVRLMRERHPRARIVAPDLHLGYYRDRSAIDRLERDVVIPARERGADRLILVGVSLGGLGALLYDLERPGEVDEMLLLAPFLGEEEALEEIEAAGGLAGWDPAPPGEDDFSRRVWLGLRERWQDEGRRPRVWLGCGRSDRLASSNRLFEREFLGEGESLWLEGGHDWETWAALLEGAPAPR